MSKENKKGSFGITMLIIIVGMISIAGLDEFVFDNAIRQFITRLF